MTSGVRQEEYGFIKKNRPNSGYDASRHDPTRIRLQEGYMEKRRAFTDLAVLNNAEPFEPFFFVVYLQKELVPLCLHQHPIEDGTRQFCSRLRFLIRR